MCCPYIVKVTDLVRKLAITICSPTESSSPSSPGLRRGRSYHVRHVGFALMNRTGTLDLDVYDDPVSNSATRVSLRLRDLVTSVGVLPGLRSREPTLCRFRCTHVDTPPGVVRHRKKRRRRGSQEDPLRKGGGRRALNRSFRAPTPSSRRVYSHARFYRRCGASGVAPLGANLF